ncbi:MAG: S9 family peptidase, partial [Spirochaetales bacterium]
AEREEVPIIPRETLFSDAERSRVRMSPDGEFLAYIAPVDGVRNVWVAPTDDPDEAEPVTFVDDRDIADYSWAATGEHIIYSRDNGGDENFRLYSVEIASDHGEESDNDPSDYERVSLTPAEDVQARVEAVSPDQPETIVVGLNERDPQLHDLYEVDITSGDRELLYENDGFTGFLLDNDYELRYAQAPASGGGMQIMERTEGDWEVYADVSLEDAITTSPVGVNAAGDTLYMIDSRDRETAALTETDVKSGESEVLFEDERADVSDAMSHPETGEVQAAASTYKRTEWHVIDEAISEDIDLLQSEIDGEVEVLSRTEDDRKWLVAGIVDDGPVEYYLYDRNELEFLFTNEPDLEDEPLASMHPLTIETRDGLEMVSYITLPPWSDRDDNGVPDEPLPMVLQVHGGPWARDNWGLNATHQWLANRGYAVLSVNFRGSTGFGKEFLNAGNKEWGAAMQDDLIDAVDWAVDEGIADEDRLAISGASYGGYAALAGLTFTPDVFAAAVSQVGPSNLVTLLESIPPYWQPEIEMFANRVGDHRTEEGEELLEERSPLNHVDRIERPLLIAQGANDPRVPQQESDQIVEEMVDSDIPVTYALYPDEGHGLARSENSLSFTAVTEAFYAEHLGGRQEPIDDDFEGSSLTIEEGLEYVPGVEEALDSDE